MWVRRILVKVRRTHVKYVSDGSGTHDMIRNAEKKHRNAMHK